MLVYPFDLLDSDGTNLMARGRRDGVPGVPARP